MTTEQPTPDLPADLVALGKFMVESACRVMHDAYERAAVGAGWETNPASRKPWADVPEANKASMRAAITALLDWLDANEMLSPVARGAGRG